MQVRRSVRVDVWRMCAPCSPPHTCTVPSAFRSWRCALTVGRFSNWGDRSAEEVSRNRGPRGSIGRAFPGGAVAFSRAPLGRLWEGRYSWMRRPVFVSRRRVSQIIRGLIPLLHRLVSPSLLRRGSVVRAFVLRAVRLGVTHRACLGLGRRED